MPESATLAYLELKTAQVLFAKPTCELAAAQRDQVRELALQQYALEASVLRAPEALTAQVPRASLEDALAVIRGRYPEAAEFDADLARNDLDQNAYLLALERELKVEAVLEIVGGSAPRVSEIDVELSYPYHPDQFRRPETRRARHILVTLNPELAENTATAARARIEAIAARLAKSPKRFEEQALKHSECPTAMQGGLLGELPRGKLYPELDAALFTLDAGQTSGVLDSPLGFHLLRCEAIQVERVLGLEQARGAIREMLEKRRVRLCQQAWMKRLQPA